MYEQRGQIEQAKRRLRTLLHLRGTSDIDIAIWQKDVSTPRYARVRQFLQWRLCRSSQKLTSQTQYVFQLDRITLGASQR